jgi:hypothetical protein
MEQLLNPLESSRELRLAVLVARYTTPLAIILVCLGIFLSQPISPVREISIGILLFSIAFNFGSLAFIKTRPVTAPWMIQVRLVTNFSTNVLQVHFLGGYFGPVWILLALTPLASAIYGTRTKTLVASLWASAALLGLQSTRIGSPLEWGQQIAHVAFIVLVSLLANELAADRN